jgi:hypothetical protein
MSRPITKVVVPVSFTGAVEVEVPAGVPTKRREALARKVALARLLATTENPDAPEEDACAEYRSEFKLSEATAGRDWDGCRTTGASGRWSLGAEAADDDHAAVAERLADKAASAGLEPEDLDDIVHELASSIAADTNNGGLEEQLAYLVEGLGAEHAERQIDELVEEHKGRGEEEQPPTTEEEDTHE